ncbi:KipI family sensor histidine kinase inhibitor [Neorhizobium huautlense]|uniref:KipI family sensor histidine kinase inhibitor n=1 Tax=Neorhizobium huautlense TaxID=67774 RepID=A0ABT9PTM2_9HYPH|nr:5-oxoprolinase subunit PxpB [Neorhizobium huautlense]MDP9837084.1 KipI family sensor histidine kinase inhibitor [Neorhizobium huautlense]
MHNPPDINYPRIIRAGDRAVTVEFSSTIDEVSNRQVLALDTCLSTNPPAGMLETVPTYRSLTVIYDPQVVRGAAMATELGHRAALQASSDTGGRLFEFPILYGGEHAADLDDLARMKDLSVEDIIRLHLEAEYRVYMIGFSPGFAYLGGLPEILHTPRLAVPRQRIEAGAIGIGGQQSSISSLPGPSGWRFIGRTPAKLFDVRRDLPFLLKAGDRIRFRRISEDEANDLDRRVARGDIIVREIAA